jgi:2-methylisocitrate lyase-like PEP mutase family enzyme
MKMDATTQNKLAAKLRALHVPGDPLVLTNVYDAATAKIAISNPHTKAIATASFAIAATYGIDDDDMTLDQNLEGIKKVASVVLPSGLPLTVDLQDGYDDVAQTVQRAIALGAVGCNLEDVNCKEGSLRTVEDAVGRIKLVLKAASEVGVPDFAVNARTDALCFGGSVEEAIERGNSYLAAGANTVFVWGGGQGRGVSMEEVGKLVDAFEGRLNVKMNLRPGFAGVVDLRKAGVARISVGPELFHKAMGAYRDAINGMLGA